MIKICKNCDKEFSILKIFINKKLLQKNKRSQVDDKNLFVNKFTFLTGFLKPKNI